MSHTHTNKPGYYREASVAITGAHAGEGSPRRSAIAPENLVTQPFPGINTAYDVLLYAERTHGPKNAMGWRDIVDIVEDEKEVIKVVDGKEITEMKKWKYFHLSDYKYITFSEVREAVSEISRGLHDLGISRDDVFNIYAITSCNWQLMAHACGSISVTVATAYDTLGEAGLTHSLNEPHCVGIFTNGELLPTVLKVLPNTLTVKYIVYDGDASSTFVESLKAIRPDELQVLTLKKLRKAGRERTEEPLEERRPKPDSVACIMYTSGTTGNPKGVVIKHSNLVASLGGVWTLFKHHLTSDDSYLAYLPLAHIFEYMVELIMLFAGVPLGYGRIKTLTDGSVRHCKGDISTFRPSMMVGVPAVWEMIRKGILGKISSGGVLRKLVFNGAMMMKRNQVPVLSQIADSIVLGGVREATGGRLRIAMSGGAALNRETQVFLNVALVPIVQAYGMTESCGMCTILPPELFRHGSVGVPVPSIEIKLRDVPDAGYLSTNPVSQGEVCIRGPSVTTGYFKRPDLNEDESIFTKDGWLRTGDVGQWNPDGTLSLIDRIKNLIKLQSGEYIALERLEAAYKSCNLVSDICVHATADSKQPIAIIIPHEVHLRLALKNLSDTHVSGSLEDLCHVEKVKELVLKECNEVGKKNGFKGPEMLQAVILTPDEWTPQNGLVTAAQKVQRAKIARAFEREIQEACINH